MDPDLELLDRWCAGEQGAGSELLDRHFATLYRFFENKIAGEVDDLVQDTLLECVRARDRFKRQSTFRTYLFAIARHVLYKYFERASGSPKTIDFEDVSIESLSTSVGSRMARESDRARLVAVLRTLAVDQQLLLEMFYWQGCDREQLAEIFDIETATVGSRLHRARQAMKLALEVRDVALTASAASQPDLDAWARSLSAE